MMATLHICFDESVYETLCRAFSSHSVVCLPLHLSVDSITEPLVYKSRADEYRSLDLSSDNNISRMIKEYVSKRDSCMDQAITAWVSQNAWECCGLLHFLYDWKGTEIYCVDDSIAADSFSDHHHVFELDVHELVQLQPIRLQKEQRIEMRKRWEQLRQENSLLRVIGQQNIISVQRSFYDQRILSSISASPQRISLMIAEMYARHSRFEYEEFILSRISKLVKTGLVGVVNDHSSLTIHDYIYAAGGD